MRKILVALDGSKNATRGLEKAIDIAKENQSRIVGLNIVQVPTSYFISKSKMEMQENMIKASKKIIEDADRKCRASGVSFESKIIPGGDPGYDIVKFSKKSNSDMIVVGARGLNPLKEIFLGSVSNYVLHKSKIPVLIVK
ncbi:MAG: universal stress protein [Nitrosarchaeum sp.]|nr:universal stress protein [Nitrosarchaeum sp.]MCV0398854.1 universal stress protein [Nitrosarchaeum sp.]